MGPRIYFHEEKTYKPEALFDSDASDGLRSSILLDLARKHHLVVVCCEPGYCSASTLRSVGIQAERLGFRFIFRDFSGASPSGAYDSIIRIARDAYSKSLNTSEPTVVAMNLLPPCDEVEVGRLSHAIERLLKSNCEVIVSMLPESRQIIEEFPAHLLLTAGDLCDVSAIARDGSGFVASGEGYTRGIPVLARSLASYKGDFDSSAMPRAYWNVLGKLLEAGVRDSLCEDELRIRLAIAILGRGSFADLERALGLVDRELLYDLSLWSPLYGVDVEAGSFVCLAAHSHEWANVELPAFAALAARQQPLLAECLSILGEREEYDRMAALLRFASETTKLRLCVEWAPELADAGYVRLLSAAIASAGDSPENRHLLSLIEQMVISLTSERTGTIAEVGQTRGHLPSADEKASLCLGLMGLREQLRTMSGLDVVLAGSRSGLRTRLEVHREAFGALMAGRFGRALELLVPLSSGKEISSVTECVLRADMAAAQIFACGASWNDRSVLVACREYLTSKGYFGLLGYVWGLELVVEALCTSPSGTAGLIRTKAAKSGDLLIKALALVSEAFGLLHRKPSAYILASIAAARNTCKEVSWVYGARVCGVLDQVAHFQLGECAGLYVVGEDDGIGAVSEVVGELAHDARAGTVPATALVRPVPVDELWLIIALCDGMGEVSYALEDQIPVEWRRALDVARKNSLNVTKLLGGVGGAERAAHVHDMVSRGVRITVFGGFGLIADGKKVSDWYLGVRDAKPLLEFLALQPGHVASREHIALMLWPEVSDKAKALQKVYSATAAARKALLKHGYEGDVFCSNKATKSVGLTSDLVSCDVDDFICHANAAIDGAGDIRICDSALKAEGLYAGDLCILSDDQSGYLAMRRDELRRLYADAMIAGGEAALRLDKKRLAARFANDALYIDGLREDAMALLIKALRRSGRGDEAQRRYKRFALKLADATGRIPSVALQSAISEPLGTIMRGAEPISASGGARE